MDVKLIMFREDGSRRDFPLAEGTTVIGRNEESGIRIPLAIVSRRHAEIDVDEDGAVLKDLGGANGTYLNNRKVEDEEDLEGGDQIMIGPVVFTVVIDGDPGEDELVEIRSKMSVGQAAQSGPSVGTSKHVYMSEDEVDPIAALEALASSTDQTAINPEDEE